MERTPIGGNNISEETSAYRSYRKREMNKAKHFNISSTESLEKFATTIELVNKNKVNRTNAFENRLIDEISLLFEEFAKGGSIESLWQKYSTGIEACGKIYGLCVDSVHSDTISVLQGLNRTGVIQEVEEENRQDEKKKKKKVLGGACTLESDEGQISTTRFDKYEEYDVYFKTISSKFDASNFGGLLFNNISVTDNLDLVFASDYPMTERIEEPSVKIAFPTIEIENLESLELGEKIQVFSKDSISNTKLAEALMNMEKANEYMVESESEEMYVDESIEEPRLQENENFDGIEECEREALSENLATRIKKLAENDDYKFFNKPSAWAGFEYAKGIVCGSIKTAEKSQKKKRKEKDEDDFFLDINFKLDQENFFPLPKKTQTNTLSENTRKNWKDAKITLPEDFRFTLKRFTQLFTRPNTFVKSIKGDTGNERKHVVIESDLENSVDDGLFIENQRLNLEGNEELQMKYSIKAKQVDIKKLKETILEKLSSTSVNETFYGVLENLSAILPDSEIEQLSVHSCFITMLHLANENEFTLQKSGECDFRIIKNK